MSGVRAELVRRGRGQVAFVVDATDGTDARALVGIGWSRGDSGRLVRVLDDGPGLEQVFDRFERSLPQMLRQATGEERVDWETALDEVAGRLHDSGIDWWLYGSGALAVRGIALPVGDIDLVVDDPASTARLFDDLLIEPVTRHEGWVATWTGRAFHGAIIEWLSDARPTGLEPPTEQEPAARDHLETVRWQGHEIAVTSLALAGVSAARRGLLERTGLVERALGHRPEATS